VPFIPSIILDVCLYAHLVALPAHKFGGQFFDFKRATVFCFGHCLSKHTMTRNAKNLGEWLQGYAYARTPCVCSGERAVLVFEKTTFFRPSGYFLWSNGFDNLVLNSILF